MRFHTTFGHGGASVMGWPNWFSKATKGDPAEAGADAGQPLSGAPVTDAAMPPAGMAIEAVPYDEQVLQAGWIPAERLDGAGAETAQSPAPGEDALQDALAFLARVYNNQGC